MISYRNPIIPGFYPDPSICRVGEEYYLVNSSFEFFPGVPLLHSRDLIHWEQLGYVLTRESQLPLEGCHTSGGIYAPTIRFNNGRFYMTTTNVSNRGNFFVWTDDIRGEWSDPVWVNQGGIDPSIFFDEDGTVYFSSTFSDDKGQCIGQCIIDINTGRMLTETRAIWHGTGGKYPEGPHLYKRNGLYYLMIAEGGTEYGHMETIARSVSPWGPYEGCPRNPILTHRDSDLGKVLFQGLGHADITETVDGECWIVFHGIRPTQYMLHHLGRETMIAPLSWDSEGWPVINNGQLIAPEMQVEKVPGSCHVLPLQTQPDRDDFMENSPAITWSYLRNPKMENYIFDQRPSYLGLSGSAVTLDDIGTPTFLGRRQQHFDVRAQTLIDFQPGKPDDQAGITIFHTNEHHYDMVITKRNDVRAAVLKKRVGDILVESSPVILPEEGEIILRVDATKTEYFFFAGTDENNLRPVGQGRTQLLSTECMACTFTGCFIGLFAQGSGTAWFDYFDYIPDEQI